jgi:hypothetical protein
METQQFHSIDGWKTLFGFIQSGFQMIFICCRFEMEIKMKQNVEESVEF